MSRQPDARTHPGETCVGERETQGGSPNGTRDDKSTVIAHTLENLQASTQTHSIVMMGDRRHDVEGAREHGIDTIGVLWGYGTAEELTDAGAIALVETSTAAGDLLLNR